MLSLNWLGLLCGLLLKVTQCGALEYDKRLLVQKTHCSKPKASHGSIKCSDHVMKVGSTCTLTCDHGFHPSNSHTTIKCLSTLALSPRAYCHPIACPAPPTLTNGAFKCPSKVHVHKFMDKCHLECEPGFQLTSHSDITCKASGTWSAHGWCVHVLCPAIPTVVHGGYKCTTVLHKVNTVCHLHCDPNFKPSLKNSDITCRHSGTWSVAANCVPIECPSPPSVNNGVYLCSSQVHTVNSVCHLNCDKDFKPSISTVDIKCQTTGKWTPLSSCVQTPCPSPPAISQGTFSCSSGSVHNPGSTCSLTCSSGYTPSNSYTTITCLSTSKWSTSATCIRAIECPTPPSVNNGVYLCSSQVHTVNSVCHLNCDKDFKPSISTVDIKCQTTGKWTPLSSCIQTPCPSPPAVSQGTFSCSSGSVHNPGSTCSLSCSSGYTPSNSYTTITCLSTLQWSTSATCIRAIECLTPPSINNGVYICSSQVHKVNSVCHLNCDKDFKPSTSTVDIKCQSTGTWTPLASCIQTPCPSPPAVSQGTFSCSSGSVHNPGSTCSLTCSSGYTPSNSYTTITCLSTSNWSTSATCISAIECPSPPSVNNGVYLCSSPVHKVNSVCHLNCDKDFQPSTSTVDITCQNTGTWTPLASCIQTPCPSPPAVSQGTFSCLSGSVHNPGSTCSLTCSSGYEPSNSYTTITCLSTSKWSTSATCIKDAVIEQHMSTIETSKIAPAGRLLTTITTLRTTTSTTTSTTTTTTITSETTLPSTEKSTQTTLPSTEKSTQTLLPSTEQRAQKTLPLTEKSTQTTLLSTEKSTQTTLPSTEKSTQTTLSTTEKTTQTTLPLTTLSTSAMITAQSSPQTTVKPLDCEVCSGSLCGLIPNNDPLVNCPTEQPYCMNHVDNDKTGSKTVTKSCANEDECNRRWWHETSDKSNCVDFNPTNIYNYQLSCTYCCTKPGCNKDIVPARSTLFIGHD